MKPTAEPSGLRILTWNLWHGLNPYEPYRMRPMETRAAHALRMERQLAVLRDRCAEPGVIACLQEVNPLAARFAELEQGLGLAGGACLVNAGLKLAGIGIPRGLQEGLAILAGSALADPRFEQCTLSGRALELQTPRGLSWLTLQTGERRKALLCEATLGGRRVAIVNLHLHHGPDAGPENLARKHAELTRLREWLAPRAGEWDLLAVGGDFNCGKDSTCLDPLRELGLVDAAELAGVAQPPTWAPAENRLAMRSAELADQGATRDWDASDHVFDRVYLRTRAPLRKVRLAGIREPELSDHYGTVVDLEF